MHSTRALAVSPLFRFFLRTRITRPQILLGALYVLTILHLSLWTVKHTDLAYRIHWFWMILPAVWPLWLIDETFDLDGPMRLFVIPGHDLGRLFVSYACSRLIFALAVAVFSVVVTLNVRILEPDPLTLGAMFASAAATCVIVVAYATFLGTVANGKTLLILLYAAFIVIIVVELKLDDVSRTIASFVLVPLWILEQEDSRAILSDEPWRYLEVVSVAAVWLLAAWGVFRRRFR